jgi:menaquinone-dependent protoporphyrinogen IX oxidase
MKSQKIAVVYKSKYGTTKQYAEWIAEALESPLFESSKIKSSQLEDYDVVIYGGGLYAGGIDGIKLVSKATCKKLVVFTVGLANIETTDFSGFLTKAFTQEQLATIKVFHLRGAMNYKQLSLIHKGMMAVVKKEAEKKPIAERTNDDVLMLETYGKEVDFMDKGTITPIVEYIGSL